MSGIGGNASLPRREAQSDPGAPSPPYWGIAYGTFQDRRSWCLVHRETEFCVIVSGVCWRRCLPSAQDLKLQAPGALVPTRMGQAAQARLRHLIQVQGGPSEEWFTAVRTSARFHSVVPRTRCHRLRRSYRGRRHCPATRPRSFRRGCAGSRQPRSPGPCS